MTWGSAGLVTIYVVLAGALLTLNLFSFTTWRMKVLMVIFVTLSYAMLYFSFPPILGWSTTEKLPKRFSLIGVYAQEPDPATGARGDIYFWAVDRNPSALYPNTPRGYQLDFTPELHAKVKEAGQKLKKNIPQVGEADENPDKGPHGVPQEEKEGSAISVKPKFTIQFVDESVDTLPVKTAE